MREETKIKMLDIRFNAVKQEQLLEEVFRNIEEKKRTSIMFVNVDVAIKAEKDELLKQALNESEMVLADGMPIIWISKLFKTPLPEKISGSDFVPELCRMAAQKGKKLFRHHFPGVRCCGRKGSGKSVDEISGNSDFRLVFASLWL